jgi:hypothetical protein
MKCIGTFTLGMLLISGFTSLAQDEGALIKKARVVSKANTVYFTLGPSLQFSGDYGGGLYAAAGFIKRSNRIVSMGPSFSFTKSDYDNKLSNEYFVEEGGYEIRKLKLQGGDLKLSSIGLDIKFDFIPSERVKKFSAYFIAKPFLLISNRSKVTGTNQPYFRNDIFDTDTNSWEESDIPVEISNEKWNAKTEVTGGLSAGVGVAWNLTSGVSLFAQSLSGFTLPMTYINTNAFPSNLDGYKEPNYPFVKKSFVSLNISLGVSYTF